MAVIQNHCAPIWLSINPGWYHNCCNSVNLVTFYRPVSLLSFTQFRLIYAAIFGAMSSTLLSLPVNMQDQSHIETDSIAWGLIYQFGELSILHHRLTVNPPRIGHSVNHICRSLFINIYRTKILSCEGTIFAV